MTSAFNVTASSQSPVIFTGRSKVHSLYLYIGVIIPAYTAHGHYRTANNELHQQNFLFIYFLIGTIPMCFH